MVSGMSTDSSRSSSSEGFSDMMLSTLRLTSLGLSRRRRSLQLLLVGRNWLYGGIQSLQGAVYGVRHGVVQLWRGAGAVCRTVWVVLVVVGCQAMPLDVLWIWLWRRWPVARVMRELSHLLARRSCLPPHFFNCRETRSQEFPEWIASKGQLRGRVVACGPLLLSRAVKVPSNAPHSPSPSDSTFHPL